MTQAKVMHQIRTRRALRARVKLTGTASRPRLSVFRSNRYIYAQLIDDDAGKTLISVSSIGRSEGKTKAAEDLGMAVAKKAKDAGIHEAVFDRGAYQYHGRVKAVCESAKKAGMKI